MFFTPAYILAIRAMMCIAICLSSMACILLLLGMECTRILEENPDHKRKIMFVSAAFFFATGHKFALLSILYFLISCL